METPNKLELLKDVYEEGGKLDLVVGKLLEATLSDCRQRWDHYQTALQEFEQRFGMDSETFTSVLKRGLWGMIRISSNGRGSMSYPSIFCRRVNARGSGIPRAAHRSLCWWWVVSEGNNLLDKFRVGLFL